MRLSALLLASCQIAAAQTCSDTCATQDRDGTAQVANNGVCEEPRLGAPCEATHACACPEYSDATDCEALRPCSSGSKPPPPVPMLIPPPAPSPMPQSVHGDSGAGVGGGRTNAGEMPSVEVTRLSVTATPYQDLQCNDRATCDHLAPRPPESTEPLPEWLAGDEDLARRIDLADSTLGTECTDAIRTSASLAPAATAELISGECTSCHAIRQAQRAVGSGTWYPCFTEGDMEGIPELGIPGLVAQGVNPEFVKITCESDESYSVEHFSDTECTEANKVSNDDINAAIMAVVEGIVSIYFLSFFMYGMGDHADAAVSGIMGCTSTDFNSWSGVSSPQTHCATMVLASFDEACLRTLAENDPFVMAVLTQQAVEDLHEHDPDSDEYDPDADPVGWEERGMTRVGDNLIENYWTAEITLNGCPAPSPPPLEASRSKRERVIPAVMLAALLLASS